MLAPLALLVLGLTPTPQSPESWRAVLECPGGELPFELVLVAGAPLELRNGSELIRLSGEDAIDGRKRFVLPPYDSAVEYAPIGDQRLWGEWTKTGPSGPATMPFRATRWPSVRHPRDGARRERGPMFPLEGEPLDVAGRWRVQFGKDPNPAVAIFAVRADQHDQLPDGEITGTFLTTTGDYRYLAGTARGKELRLSCFDGAHAFLFVARVQPDGSLKGEFWSGTTWNEVWTARRDDQAALPDAFTLSKADPKRPLADLRYPDAEGKEQRLGDHLGKVTLVYLFGTWCPNCGDAAAFLRELQQRYGKDGLRVVGLAFEHGYDHERIAGVLKDYRQRYGIDWPILWCGSSDKAKASLAFQILDRVRAYPTTMFVDAEGAIRAVHTGFTGPAAPAEHEAQKKSFTSLVERLLSEARSGR